MEKYKAIDYDHQQDSFFCNAMLSNMTGPFEAHWTFDRDGEMRTDVRALTGEEFGLLWDGIAASLGTGGVFGRCLVDDPTRLIDPAAHHVIATLQVNGSVVQHRTYMVPSDEADPAFMAWLAALAAPGATPRDVSWPPCGPQSSDGPTIRKADAALRHGRVGGVDEMAAVPV